jgi:Flp pilus assembly protein TadG
VGPETTSKKKWGRQRDDERGAELVEFAIVVVVLVMLLYGLFLFGMSFGAKSTINHAADDASRAALATYNYDIGIGDSVTQAESDATTTAQQTIEKDLDWINSSTTCGSSTPTSSTPEQCLVSFPTSGTLCGGNACVEVTAAYDYAKSLPAPPLFSNIINISDLSSTSTVLLTSSQE